MDMRMRSTEPVEILSSNLHALMRLKDWTQTELAVRSGVSQRMISHILSKSAACSIATLDAIALPFGLKGWHLLIPELSNLGQDPTKVAELMQRLGEASPTTHELIDKLLQVTQR